MVLLRRRSRKNATAAAASVTISGTQVINELSIAGVIHVKVVRLAEAVEVTTVVVVIRVFVVTVDVPLIIAVNVSDVVCVLVLTVICFSISALNCSRLQPLTILEVGMSGPPSPAESIE